MIGSNNVRVCKGVPTINNFRGSDGTPIVIDLYTRIAYFLYNNTIYPLAPNPSSTGAFSDGFSSGFS